MQKRLEDELRQVAEKREAVTHWEEQIAEIIQWYVDLPPPQTTLTKKSREVNYLRNKDALLRTLTRKHGK